ncbi:hypothetical protein GGR52DRAFT_139543 [Hypoxylon sp. FL1284]|nr:hypothetical protein GGR52DRAFT_139543 [Hypoxylon sp. FL1284]
MAFIPWAAHGEGVLTVPLALFCMALEAASDNNWIDYHYAKFNTWRQYDNGTFIHNFTGSVKAKLDRRDVLQNPQAWEAAEPAESAESAEYAESTPTTEYPLPSRIVPVFDTGEASTSAPQRGHSGSMSQIPQGEESQREKVVVESSSSALEQPDEDDEQTRTSRRSTRDRCRHVRFRQGMMHLYYTNKHGQEVSTSKKEWKRVEDGWELKVQSTVYFTKTFPST